MILFAQVLSEAEHAGLVTSHNAAWWEMDRRFYNVNAPVYACAFGEYNDGSSL